ncbi:MAG: hypothetical protein IJ945_04190 [Oscillospiraceae bacterium]|nr:hypothetical protein [Oscillospiraceae bacterium]
MKLNKILALILAFVMVFSFAACGNDEPANNVDEPSGDIVIGGGEALANLNIRKAIGMAFNKQAICDNILRNGSVPADFCIPVGLATGPDGKDYRESSGLTYNEYDVAEAQALWAAGLEELGLDGVELTVIFDDEEAIKLVAEFIQQELQTNLAGLTITLQPYPKKQRSDLMKAHDYDLGLCRWGPDYADPLTYLDLWTDGYTHNYGNWHSDEYMEILGKIKTVEYATNPEARWELIKEAEKIIADESVILPVYQNCNASLIKSDVEGIEFHAVGLNRVYNNATNADGSALGVHVTAAIDSIDPALTSAGDDFEVIGTMVEGLFRCDASGAAIPGMAESYEVDENGTWTFHLRDAKWSNGDPVTADDFVYAWQRCFTIPAEYVFLFETAGIKNAAAIIAGEKDVTELGVYAVDDKTLVVEFDVPCAFFDSLMFFPVFYPVNRAFAEECGDLYGSAPEYYLSNGPFELIEYTPAATEFSMAKNENYWAADEIKIAGLNYKVILDSQQAYLAYQNNELDVCVLSSELADLLKTDPEFVATESGYLWYMSPNVSLGN